MDRTNIWTNFLNESSKKSINPEAVCLLLGDSTVNKKNIIKSMHEVGTLTTSSTAMVHKDQLSNMVDDNHDSILSYTYFDVEDRNIERTVKLHFWCFEQLLFDDSLSLLKMANSLQKVCLSM